MTSISSFDAPKAPRIAFEVCNSKYLATGLDLEILGDAALSLLAPSIWQTGRISAFLHLTMECMR